MKSTRRNLKTGVVLTLIATVGLSSFTACGSSSASGNASAKSNDKVQTIVVGSGNGYKPYCYLDESGKAVGYEYDVLKEVDKLLPQYKFKYENMNFDNVILSLDSGKVDLAAHQYEYTDERAKKYLFSKESYTSYVTYFSVPSTDNTTKSIKDLAGKKVDVGGSTSASNQILRDYNKKHPKEALIIETHDSTQTQEERIAELKSGAVKALVSTKPDIARLNKDAGDKNFSKAIGDPINNSKTYYLYRKDETELQTAVDGALKKLKENGKLAEISEKWLGGDFTE